MVGDPRPPARIVDRRAGIKKLRREGRCRACGLATRSYLTRAHLVPRGQRGDDVDENIIPLCGSGTTGCHGALTDHHKASWPSLLEGASWHQVASAVRATLRLEEEKYILDKKGAEWLGRVYPR
jgi:hypothetical protein